MFNFIKTMLKDYIGEFLLKGISKMRNILKVMRDKYKIGPKTFATIIFGIVFFATMPLPLINQIISLAGIVAIVLIYEVLLSS